jgi:hypothetical protein
MSMRARGLLVKVLALAYVLFAAELFVRVFSPVPLFPRNVVATDYGVRGNKPNSVYVHTSPDVQVEFRINKKGIRADEEIPYAKPPGVLRIVALGDSFGMGYEVDVRETFLAHMEIALRQRGIRAQVVNMSVSGHGTSEQLLTLRAEGFKYQPDLVLVCWHSSDVEDNVRSGLFQLRGGALVQIASSYLPGVKIREKLEMVPLYRWAEEHSQLYGFLRETTASRFKQWILDLRGNTGQDASQKPSNTADNVSKQPSAANAGGLTRKSELNPPEQLSVALLLAIQSEAKARGARTLVLDIPDAVTRTQFVTSFPHDPTGANFGLVVVSPIAQFEAQRGAILYNEHSHWHLTPRATRIIGALLAQTVVKR